jgi:hypothetical protein
MRRFLFSLLGVVFVIGVAFVVVVLRTGPLGGSLSAPHPGKVWMTDPVTVGFAQGTDVSHASVSLSPTTPASTVIQGKDVIVTPKTAWLPNRSYTLSIAKIKNGILGSSNTWSGSFQTRNGFEPSNTTSDIGSNYSTVPPIQIVVENSDPARPQRGLQQADMVFEYVSEYSITRMTTVYFSKPAGQIGPVRSCRLINIPLGEAFHGALMCSGLSPGTDARIKAANPPVHYVTNDHDPDSHFTRVSFNFAPHNLFTDAARALRWRNESHATAPDYSIDGSHADTVYGTQAAAPNVPLHAVTYSYDPGSRTYLRFDHGSPFTDGATGRQLHVKNVILMHVSYQVMNYVEDESGGAHSVFYNLIGSGPAEIYSDGSMIQVTWHMSTDLPAYFTDAQGNVIRLNTGLTWIHVLGNGQTH